MISLLKRIARHVYRWRSAITGRWVSRDYAKAHPSETVRERK